MIIISRETLQSILPASAQYVNYRSDLGVTMAAGVSQWDNLVSGGSFPMLQGVGSSQFARNLRDTTGSLLPTIFGDGLDDYMVCGLDLAAPSVGDPWTIWLIAKILTRFSGASICMAGNTNHAAISQSTGTSVLQRNTGSLPNAEMPDNTWRLIEATYTGTAADILRVNGVDASTGTGAGVTNPTAGWALSARTDGAALGHNAYQEVSVTRALTSPQRTSMRSYFAKRYPHVGMV